MSQPALLDEISLAASLARDSFFEFVREMWHVVVPEKPRWNWHIEFLCDELQRMAERVFRGEPKEYDLIVNISPGSTKSTIVSVMFPAWTWTRMPTARHIVATHGFDLGQDLSRKCRDVVLSREIAGKGLHDLRPGYQVLFPEVRLRADQNTKSYFVNEKGGYRKAVTVGGVNPVGFHGHFILVDDPIDPQKAVSEAEIKNANDFMNMTLPSRKVDKEVTPTVLIMQRLHQNDPSGNRLMNTESGAVRHICLPADMKEGYEVKPRSLRRKYVDGLMDPVRISRKVLQEARGQLGEYGYAGQFGQSPVPMGGAMFEVDKLVIAPRAPSRDRFKRGKLIRFWDKAATHEAGAWTVGVLIGEDIDGNIWILDVIRFRKGVTERERIIRQTAEIDGRGVWIGLEQEPGSGGKESAQGWVVKLDRPTGDKAIRAEPFAAQVGAGTVYIVTANWNVSYIDELRHFPESTYKDQVDASSGGFNIVATKKTRVGAFGSGSKP
jgi:predicted phage terminase large subunit-like protein